MKFESKTFLNFYYYFFLQIETINSVPTCGNCLTEHFPQMRALAHETTTKYVQIKEVNMDQIECQVLGEVPMVAECAFMNLPL